MKGELNKIKIASVYLFHKVLNDLQSKFTNFIKYMNAYMHMLIDSY